jgi:Fe-S oxidoreductase
VVTDCASCQSALTEYPDINKKIITFAEFFTDENISFNFEKPVKVTFHKPCHFKNYEKIKTILNKCKNVEYIEMQGYDECCGFAGQFAITNRKYSVELSKIKAQNADNTGADIILTACPACELGLRQGFIHIGKPFKKIMNITEFLSLATNIK